MVSIYYYKFKSVLSESLILALSCIICAALLLAWWARSCWHPWFWLNPCRIIRLCHANCTITTVIGLHIKALWSIWLIETWRWHKSRGTIVQHLLTLAHVKVLHDWRKTSLIHWVSLRYKWLCILVVAEHIGWTSLIEITCILVLTILIRLLPLLRLVVCIGLLLSICWNSLIWRYKDVRWVLRYRSSTGYCFNLFNSKFLFRVSLILFTKSLVFFIHVHNQFLHMIACY